MRLRLVIVRHGLPATRILWTVPIAPSSRSVSASEITSTTAPNAAFGHGGCTVAQLLEDVNEVVPLETTTDTLGESDEIGGQWGLEDYVVEVNGFECLHFMDVGGLLRDGDEVVIRALDLSDLRARRLSGRVQISADGRRLIDGVPFGRPYLKRSFSNRPQIRIPSRKRRRANHVGLPDNLRDDYDGEQVPGLINQHGRELALYDNGSVLSSEQGTVIRRSPGLFGDANESDYELESSYDENEDLTQELENLKKEANDTMITDLADIESPPVTRNSGRVSRLMHRNINRDPVPTSSPARLSTSSTTRLNNNSSVGVAEPSPKSTKSVRFEPPLDKQEPDTLTGLSSSSESEDGSSESEEDSKSESSYSTESDTSDGTDTSREDGNDSSDTDSSDDSSVSSDSESESEDAIAPARPKQKTPGIYTAPGKGSSKTKNSNRRKKLRARLKKLKELGHLGPEANFDDLRAWEIQHGKRPLVELTDLERTPGAQVRSEQSLFEKKREQLLRDLASGGIDVDAHSEKENIPPQYKNGKQAGKSDAGMETTTANTADKHPHEVETGAEGEESPQSNKRRKLDMSSTKRLVFGSLGVRTPKTKEDEENTRNKLAGPRKDYVMKETPGVPIEQEAEDDFEGDWQSKLIVAATECLYEDVQLQPPPFPFKQRWDPEAASLIRERKGTKNSKRRRRKNKQWQDYEEEEYYDDAGYVGDGTEDYINGDTTLNYDDGYADEETDLPYLPDDLNSVPALSKSDVATGAIIAFKQLDLSKATGWQPRVSEYRVAKVAKLLEDGTISVQLAKRDRENRETVVDENGVREYSGLEMPGDDDDDDEDDGMRDLLFEDLLEPKLLSTVVNGDQEPSLLDLRGSNASADDTFTSVDAELPDSSQTRHEISQLIRDAGFRDTFDSDVGVTVNATADDQELTNTDAAAAETAAADEEIGNISSVRSPPVVEDRLGHESTEEDEDWGGNGDTEFEEDAHSREDEIATNVVAVDEDDRSSHDGLAIDGDVANGNDIPHQQIKEGPISWQHPVETPAETKTMDYPQLPPLSSQQEAEAEAEAQIGQIGDEERGNRYSGDSPSHGPVVSQNKSLLSESSEIGSMVPNPFYEQDRSRTLVEEEPETQDTYETGDPPETAVQQPHSAVDGLKEASLMQDDTEIDIDNIDLPSPSALWASTAPARSEQNTGAPALSAVNKARRALSSPRQLSSSPAFEALERQPQSLVPVNGKLNSSSAPAFETMESEQQLVHLGESIIDLTNSSPLVSPDDSSDSDYAKSYGLPRGPGWVKKNIPATDRRTRSSTGGEGSALNSSPPTRRSNVK